MLPMSVFLQNPTDLKAFQSLLQEKNNIVLTTHVNPDGDAIGSTMGWMDILIKLGKNVKGIIPSAMPAFLEWMDPQQQLINYRNNPEAANKALEQAELILCLDYNTLSRTDAVAEPVEASKAIKVLLDHHQEPDNFDINFSDTQASSTCEMVCQALSALGLIDQLSSDGAACLFTGIMTDTGSFRYSATTATTFEMASVLIAKGVKPSEINDKLNNTSTADRVKLTGHALYNKLSYLKGERVAYIYLSEEELKAHNYQAGDTEGLVNIALGVANVEMSVLFKQSEEKIKISFRSKGGILVNEFSKKYFNGGGHTHAAGGVSFDTWEQTFERFKKAVDETF